MPTISVYIKTLPGIPAQHLLEQTASILLEPFLPFGISVSEGPILSNKTSLKPLNKFMFDRPNFSSRGRKKSEAVFNWCRTLRDYPPLYGSLSTYIKFE